LIFLLDGPSALGLN